MNCIWNKNYPQTSQIVDFFVQAGKNPGKINDLNLPKTPSKRITVRTTQRTNGEKKLDSRPRCEEDEVLTKAQGGLRLVNGLSQRCVWEFCLGSLKIPKEKTVFFWSLKQPKATFQGWGYLSLHPDFWRKKHVCWIILDNFGSFCDLKMHFGEGERFF